MTERDRNHPQKAACVHVAASRRAADEPRGDSAGERRRDAGRPSCELCCDAFGEWWRLALVFQEAQPSRSRRCICGSHLCPTKAHTRSQGGAQRSLVVGRPVVRDARQRQQEGAVQRPRQALRCRRAGQLAKAEQQRPSVLRCNGCLHGGGLGRLCGSGCRFWWRSGALLADM